MASNYQQHGADGTFCPICFEIFRNPKGLECLHTFCESCIHEYILKLNEEERLKHGIECPLCRHITSMKDKEIHPHEWASSLRPNYALVSLLETVKLQSDIPIANTHLICGPCLAQNLEVPAAIFCNTCNEHHCEVCTTNHDRFSFMKGHDITTVEPGSKHSTSISKLQVCKCEIHNKRIKFIYRDENVLCCSTCAIVKHRKCKLVVEIEDMPAITIDQEKAMKTEMRDLKNQLESASKYFIHSREQLCSSVKGLAKILRDQKSKIDNAFDKFSAMVLKDAEEVLRKKSAEFNNEETNCKDLKLSLDDLLETADAADYVSTVQRYILQHQMKANYADLQINAGSVFPHLQSVNVELKFDEKLIPFINSNTQLGLLHRNIDQKSITSIPDHREITAQFERHIKVNRRMLQVPAPITGMDLFKDGRLVVIDNKHKYIAVLNSDFEIVASSTVSWTPIDVVLISENEFVVTHSFGIERFLVDKNNLITHMGSTPTTTETCSISVMDNDTFIVSIFNSTKPVMTVSKTGTEEHLNIEFPKRRYENVFVSKCLFVKTADSQVLAFTYQR